MSQSSTHTHTHRLLWLLFLRGTIIRRHFARHSPPLLVCLPHITVPWTEKLEQRVVEPRLRASCRSDLTTLPWWINFNSKEERKKKKKKLDRKLPPGFSLKRSDSYRIDLALVQSSPVHQLCAENSVTLGVLEFSIRHRLIGSSPRTYIAPSNLRWLTSMIREYEVSKYFLNRHFLGFRSC